MLLWSDSKPQEDPDAGHDDTHDGGDHPVRLTSHLCLLWGEETVAYTQK